MEYFIEVIIPLSLDTKYTYSVDPNQIKEISKGMRVVVPFGKSKSYTAIVYKLNSDAPANYIAKEIDCVLDTKPIVPEIQIKFWEWISEYYQASIGDVYRTAIPSAFLLESQMEISKNNFPKDISSLSDDEFLIYEALNISNLTVKEISEIVQKKHVLKILKDMLSKDYIEIDYKILRQKNQFQHEKPFQQRVPLLISFQLRCSLDGKQNKIHLLLD